MPDVWSSGAGAALRECGERMLSARDHSFVAFKGEAASRVFTLDSRLWRTFGALVRPSLRTTDTSPAAADRVCRPYRLFVLLTVAFVFIGPSLGLLRRVHGDGHVLTLAKSFVAAIGLSISLIVYEH